VKQSPGSETGQEGGFQPDWLVKLRRARRSTAGKHGLKPGKAWAGYAWPWWELYGRTLEGRERKTQGIDLFLKNASSDHQVYGERNGKNRKGFCRDVTWRCLVGTWRLLRELTVRNVGVNSGGEAWHRSVWRPLYIRLVLHVSLTLAYRKAMSKTLTNIHRSSHFPASRLTSTGSWRRRWLNSTSCASMAPFGFPINNIISLKHGSVGQIERLLIPRSSVWLHHLKPENTNSYGFELHRASIKGTKLLLKVIKAIMIMMMILSK